jgi:ABC-type transporter Mla subunit MlaD
MNERVVQFRVGVMVLATLIITGILVLLFGELPKFVRGTYTIYVRFPEAPGVARETPVRRSGILIGRVSEDPDFDENDNVIVTLEIDGDRVIRESDEIRITTSLLGDSEIEVIRRQAFEGTVEQNAARPEIPDEQPIEAPAESDSAPSEDTTENDNSQAAASRRSVFLLAVLQPKAPDQQKIRDAKPRVQAPSKEIREGKPKVADPPPPRRQVSDAQVPEGAILEGRVSSLGLESFTDLKDDFAATARSLDRAGEEVGRLASRMNEMFDRNEEQFERIINTTEQAMTSFDRAMTNINDVVGDQEVRNDLKRAFRDLPGLLDDTRGAVVGIEQAMRLVDSNLRNLEGLTKPLGDRGEAIVGNIDSSIAQLNSLLAQVEQFSRSLNSREGTLGQLINNPDVYLELNQAAQNINEITQRLKPIVEDARIFSDKIARHPGVIIRDAIKPGSGTKWVTE